MGNPAVLHADLRREGRRTRDQRERDHSRRDQDQSVALTCEVARARRQGADYGGDSGEERPHAAHDHPPGHRQYGEVPVFRVGQVSDGGGRVHRRRVVSKVLGQK